jgi:hypothetical protein
MVVDMEKVVEKQKDPIAVELGRRGGMASAHNAAPGEMARRGGLGGRARRVLEAQAVATAATALVLKWVPWKKLKRVTGDPFAYIAKEWAARLPKAYEEVLDAAMRGEPVPPIVLELLKTMTLMSPLSPGRLRSAAEAADAASSNGLDLSLIDDSVLSALVGVTLNGNGDSGAFLKG